MRSFAGGRLAGFCRPVFIAFLLTERCNARCLHCDIWKNRGKEDCAGVDDWKKVLKDLRSWLGPVGVVFTGGEALMYPQAIELVQFAVSLGFALEVLTNGYWNDQARIETLALADPWRITVSLDGLGAIHSKIRGREDFFDKTSRTLATLARVRVEKALTFRILLKTVIMEHNLDGLCEVARFAAREGIQVLYQPIEQNYGTPLDRRWFESSPNWPRDPAKAVRKIRELMDLKRAGLPIANTESQFEAMIGYFKDPAGLGLVTRAHVAHERKVTCCALTSLQFQANGNVTVCANRPPIGNIRVAPIRQLWKQRSRAWRDGCCLAENEPSSVVAAGGGG